MSVYIVVAREDDTIPVCEAYAGASAALGRAFQLASTFAGPGRPDLWDSSPQEKQYPDCSVMWLFMDTNKHTVQVIYRPRIEASVPSSKDVASVVPPTTPPIHQTSQTSFSGTSSPRPSYDFRDRTLPVGWKQNGQPALMGDLLDNPYDIQDPLNLTDAQKWAIVTTRVRMSLGWKGIPKGSPIAWFHRDALVQLQSKSGIGELLRDGEIESLHHLREDLVSGVISP